MNDLQDCRIAIVGVGLLGGVLLDRLLTCGGCVKEQIIACEPDAARRQEIASRAGVETHAENAAAAQADVIVLAVPPPAVAPVLRELAPHLRPGTLVVSVAAAVPLAAMEAVVPPGVAVVRTLPNTPALVGQSVTPVVYGRTVTPAARARAEALLACWGQAVEVPEAQMNRCVGLTAAAPTYILPVIDALARAGAAGGLPHDVALRLAAATVQGTAALVLETGQPPEVLKALTPLQPLREDTVRQLLAEAVAEAEAKMHRLQAKVTHDA